MFALDESRLRAQFRGGPITDFGATGDSLSLVPDTNPPWVVITPVSLPGETIRARIYRQSHLCSYADFVELVKPNPQYRDDSRVKCKYFGQCSGCQYQVRRLSLHIAITVEPNTVAYSDALLRHSAKPQTGRDCKSVQALLR